MDFSSSCNVGHVVDHSPCNDGGHGNTRPPFFCDLHHWLRPGTFAFLMRSQSKISSLLWSFTPINLIAHEKTDYFCILFFPSILTWTTSQLCGAWAFDSNLESVAHNGIVQICTPNIWRTIWNNFRFSRVLWWQISQTSFLTRQSCNNYGFTSGQHIP